MDQQQALQGMYDKLLDSSKITAMVYSNSECNGFFSLPVSIIRHHNEIALLPVDEITAVINPMLAHRR